jgi:hypothetical protein
MRFTPVLFASVAAAGIYWPEESSSAAATSSSVAWPIKASTSSDPAGYWPKPSSSSVSKKGWKTTTKYETECWTVTSSSSTKVWTSVKAYPTVWADDEEDPVWSIPASSSKSTPAAPVKPTGTWSVPYCSAYTETCTVTVTASASGSWGAPVSPVKPTTPAAPVYSSAASWAAGAAKPSGTG